MAEQLLVRARENTSDLQGFDSTVQVQLAGTFTGITLCSAKPQPGRCWEGKGFEGSLSPSLTLRFCSSSASSAAPCTHGDKRDFWEEKVLCLCVQPLTHSKNCLNFHSLFYIHFIYICFLDFFPSQNWQENIPFASNQFSCDFFNFFKLLKIAHRCSWHEQKSSWLA